MSMILKLDTLKIENFKGCHYLKLDFCGRSASIYGDNAVGKTTVYDAFCWLLYGKDSKGRSDSQIKPLDADGNVADHAAITSVTAILKVDGVSMTLRKDYYERWSTKRGSAEKSYDGNTCEFYVDDVPLKKYEYEERVEEICNEDTFRILTNVAWSCEGLDWRKRRDMLFQICDLPDDKAIMAGDPRFTPLAEDMGTLSIDDYKRKLQSQRKGLNADRNTIPARLDEQKKVVGTLQEIDFDGLHVEHDATVEKISNLQEELVRISHGAQLEAKRNELAAAKNELEAIINENNAHRQSQIIPVSDRRPEFTAAIAKAKAEESRWNSLAKTEEDLIARQDDQIQKCRDLWAAANARVFAEKNCPTCGQSLPPDAQVEAMRRFEEAKERAKADAIERADAAKDVRASAVDRRDKDYASAAYAASEVHRLTAELAAYVPEEQPEISDLPDYAARVTTLDGKISLLDADVRQLMGETSTIRAAVESNIKELQAKASALESDLAKEALLVLTKERCNELMASAKTLAEELGTIDRQLYLCEEYARYKVSYVENTINSKFQLTKWKLYAEQVNGGLNDCCEATYNGVPYAALNNGMRINIGVDVISIIAEHYGVKVPLVVDNAESVTSMLNIDTQVIRLVVSENDKELRVVYEN